MFEKLDIPYCTVNKTLSFSCLPTECLMYRRNVYVPTESLMYRRNVKLFFMARKLLLLSVNLFFYCKYSLLVEEQFRLLN